MDLQSVRARAKGAWAGLRHPAATRRPTASRVLEPPACPDGQHTGPPDFVGVGVMKAGTSWWYRLIADHPGVTDVPGRPKELHFFRRFIGEDFTETDAAAYAEFFPRRPGTIAGEWTPRYMYDHWTPALLARAAPGARYLVMLRDPVDRYISGLTHDLSRGREYGASLATEHFWRGQYLDQLRLLFEHVDRDDVLVLQYERCIAAPEVEMARTYAFLGLDPDHEPAGLHDRVNPTRFDKHVLPDLHRRSLVRAYRAQLDDLTALCPSIDPALWRSVPSSPAEPS